MLSKTNRLKKEKDFRKILRQGKSFKEGFLILKVAPNSEGRVRVGISVSKKVSKKATLRNLQKRRLAAIARQKMPQTKGGLDIFLIALPGLETQNFTKIKEMCDKIFRKARVMENV